MSHISIGLRCEKTEDNPHGFKHVESIPGDEVCVLRLGGNASNTNEAANGGAKSVERNVLSSMDVKVPVYSVSYDFDMIDSTGGNSRSYELEKQHVGANYITNQDAVPQEIANPQYIDELFKAAILPRISNNNGKEQLSTEEAAKRIRKLNIVAHCHGGYVALKLEEKMQAKMQELGYSQQERNFIQSQMLVVAQAPACALGVSKSQFISFNSAYDTKAQKAINYFHTYIMRKTGLEITNLDVNTGEVIDKNRFFDLKPCYFPGKQGNMFLVKNKFNPIKEYDFLRTNEDNEHGNFLSGDEPNQTNDGRAMACLFKAILQNGIENSLMQDKVFTPLPPVDKLILRGDAEEQAEIGTYFNALCQNGKDFWSRIVNVCREDKELRLQEVVHDQLKRARKSLASLGKQNKTAECEAPKEETPELSTNDEKEIIPCVHKETPREVPRGLDI